jgi:ABC-type cobalamin/Fe3+-siderophores transport system ATPase subunit
VENILRAIQNESSHYCIISSEGMGKKTLLKLACRIGGYELIEINATINLVETKKFIFDKMKKGL